MQDCVFCSIIRGEIPSEFVYENEHFIVIRDIQPAAKEHYLAIPKKHVADLTELAADDEVEVLAGKLPRLVNDVCRQQGLDSFRLVSNCGELAGQTVSHLHFHILAGQKLGPMA